MKRKKRFLSMLLAVCLMVGLLPVSALAAENDTYQITTDIESQTFIVGQETEFSVSTNVADDAGTKTVRGHFEVNDSNDNPVTSADVYTVKYWDVTSESWLPLTGTADENGAFTLAGNTDTEYIISAADKAGNETNVTVAMHKTKSLEENLGDITKDNATSADRETVQDYLDDLKERLEDEKLTDEEKSILEELADEAQEILARLTETEQAASTEAVDQTKGITSGNVTPEDREMLEQAKEDLEQALKEFGGNLTEEEPDKPAGPEEDDGDEGVVAQTGDSADITPWIALILVSVMSMTAAVIIRRKRG